MYATYLFLCVIGVIISADYGVTWDENHQRKIGMTSFSYLFEDDQRLDSFGDRDYGVGVELPLVIVEKLLGLENYRDIYHVRHIITHILFLTCALSVYFLSYNLFQSRIVGLIAFLCFVLHPRLYAHSFFNSKDIPFMSMYAVCFWQFQRTFSRMSVWNLVLLGVATGYLINLRIMGVLFFICCIGYLLLFCFLNRGQYLRSISGIFIFILASTFTLYLGWPYLWDNPYENFVQAFRNMSKFRWDGLILFAGNLIKAIDVPWSYIPIWFGLTTPLAIQFFGLSGAILTIFAWLRQPIHSLNTEVGRNMSLYLASFAGAIGAVIVLKSVLYDGWRQMYFIYPSFVMLAAYGISRLLSLKKRALSLLVSALLVGQLGSIIVFMKNAHPLQQVYFNELISKDADYIKANYELDYWGSSLKKAFEYVLENDPSQLIYINAAAPAIENYQLLTKEQQARIILTIGDSIDQDNQGYFITYHRFHPWEYLWLVPIAENIYNHTILNNSVFSIWKYRSPVSATTVSQMVMPPADATPNRFLVRNDGTVFDKTTGLTWAQADNGHDINWQDAQTYCDEATLGGFTDWRLPRHEELIELYNAGIRTSDSNGNHSIAITNWWVWSGDSLSNNSATSVVMKYGYTRQSFKSVSYYYRVIPVRDSNR